MEPENCWEFWNCPAKIRDNCAAFKLDDGRNCFSLAKDFCPKVTNQFKHCRECPWYVEMNPYADKSGE